jgi:hypothetical protein
LQRDRRALAAQIESRVAETEDEAENENTTEGIDRDFILPRPRGELAVLSADALLRVASAYPEFQGIVRVLMEQVDKQSAPAARLITRNRLFHAALWKHGCLREAVVLQVFNGAFEAFDAGHLCPSYRDYLCERARHLAFVLLGPDHLDPLLLSESAGSGKKAATNLEVGLLHRILCNVDMRELFAKRHGTWGIERAFGTDDLENFFSELTRRAGGYMPTCEKAMAMARRAEEAARSLWDPEWAQHTSRRKRYEVHQRTTRADWNDGERVPVFWPLEIDIRRRASKRDLETLQPVAKRACRPEMRMKREGEKQAQDKPQSIRQLHRQAERTHTAAAART